MTVVPLETSPPPLLHCLDVGFDEGDFVLLKFVFGVELPVDFGDGFAPVDVAACGEVLEGDVCPSFLNIMLCDLERS